MNYKTCLIIFICAQQILGQESVFTILPSYSKIRQLDASLWEEDPLSTVKEYYLERPYHSTSQADIWEKAALSIISLGEEYNWSFAERFSEFQLLVHFIKNETLPIYNSSGISREAYGWDHWEFNALPVSSELKKYEHFKLTCDHQLKDNWCNVCQTCNHLQHIAQLLYFFKQTNNPLEAHFKKISARDKFDFGVAWYIQYHLTKLAKILAWTNDTYTKELNFLLFFCSLTNSIPKECSICLEEEEEERKLKEYPCSCKHDEKVCEKCLKSLKMCPFCSEKLPQPTCNIA